jgi:hypothetical protein
VADDDRSRIPNDIKRRVRQRCGFGCVVCGLPLYEYDHLVPWSEVKTHEADNLVLLCDRHHREKTSGLLPVAQIVEANDTPANLATGTSSPLDLHSGGHGCEALIGSNVLAWPQMRVTTSGLGYANEARTLGWSSWFSDHWLGDVWIDGRAAHTTVARLRG